MKIELENLKDTKILVNLNKDFVKLLFKSLTNRYPPKDKKLAEELGIKFNSKYGISPTLYGWYSGRRNMPMKMLTKLMELTKNYNWRDVENNLIGLKSGNGKSISIKPKFPIEFNKNLGLLIGHILGDGWIDSRFLQPCYGNTNKDLLKEYEEIMYTIFGVKSRIWVQKQSKYGETEWFKRVNSVEEIPEEHHGVLFYPEIVGKILHKIFGIFAIGRHHKEIPVLTFILPLEFKLGLIRAFYDDEASVMRSRSIRLHQDNPTILNDVKNLLKEIGIETRDINWYIKRDKKRFYFDIYSKKNFRIFEEKINFTSYSKRECLVNLIN
jgi:hypothetical protein